MNNTAITIVFSGKLDDGRDLAHDTLSVTELLKLLAPIEKAITETAGAKGRAMSLLACEPGSSANTLAVQEAYLPAFVQVHQAVRLRDVSSLPADAQQTLVEYQATLGKHGYRADLRLVDGGDVATIDADHQLAGIVEPILVRERRSIYGRVVNAGGRDATKFIHLEVLLKKTPQAVLSVTASEPLVKEVSARMFEIVHLAGEATFDFTNRQITAFHAERLLPYRETPPTEAFRGLREAAAGMFDDVDPVAHQRSARYGDDG